MQSIYYMDLTDPFQTVQFERLYQPRLDCRQHDDLYLDSDLKLADKASEPPTMRQDLVGLLRVFVLSRGPMWPLNIYYSINLSFFNRI